MTIVFAFTAAFISTMFAGALGSFIFRHFASNKAANIAAFWLTVGAAGGRYSTSLPLTADAAPAFGALAGAALALLLLWRWLLKRPADEVPSVGE